MDGIDRKRQTMRVLELLDDSARAHREGRGDDSSSLIVEACALDVDVVSAVQGGILIGEIPHPHHDPDAWALYLDANRDGLARLESGGEVR